MQYSIVTKPKVIVRPKIWIFCSETYEYVPKKHQTTMDAATRCRFIYPSAKKR